MATKKPEPSTTSPLSRDIPIDIQPAEQSRAPATGEQPEPPLYPPILEVVAESVARDYVQAVAHRLTGEEREQVESIVRTLFPYALANIAREGSIIMPRGFSRDGISARVWAEASGVLSGAVEGHIRRRMAWIGQLG